VQPNKSLDIVHPVVVACTPLGLIAVPANPLTARTTPTTNANELHRAFIVSSFACCLWTGMTQLLARR
jgi:hypothetical protein